MDAVQDKVIKQENVLSRLLRKLLNQKEEALKEVRIENSELKDLLLKQQKLINKLSDENVKLARKVSIENVSISKQNQLIECNASLKQQLLISQTQNSMLLQDLQQSQCEIKYLSKKLTKYN